MSRRVWLAALFTLAVLLVRPAPFPDVGGKTTFQNTSAGSNRVVKQVDAAGGVTCLYYASATNGAAGCATISPNPGSGKTAVVNPRGYKTTYTYDANSNRTAKNSTSYTYDNADQMTAAGGVTYTYDNNGNVTGRGSDSFQWDHENRLVSATIGGVTTTYTYNGDGLRVSRSSGGTTATYVWDVAAGLPQVLQETTGSNSSTYVYGLGRISVTDQSGAQTYFLADGLGSTVKLVDGSGASTGDYTYDVYGAVKTHTGSSTEFNFTGEQNDPNGLEYLRARYYDNATGRFLSRDPLGGGYPYAGGNPANMIDPTGLYKACGISEHPDFLGQLFCLDSTLLGGPLCDPSSGACEFYDAVAATEGNSIGLSDRFGEACVLLDGRVRNCTVGQNDSIPLFDELRGAIWGKAISALGGIGWLQDDLARLDVCLDTLKFCQQPLGDILVCVGAGFSCGGLSGNDIVCGSSVGSLLTTAIPPARGAWLIVKGAGVVFSLVGIGSSCF